MSGGKTLVKPAPSIYSATNALKTNKSISRSNLNRSIRSKNARIETSNRTERAQSITDEVNNSCSNITTSTYCNGNGVSTSSGIGLDFESVAYAEQKLNCDRESVLSGVSIDRHSHRSNDIFDTGNLSLRRESSSTYERDMDIIDLLERERSMDLKEMMERERRVERIRKKQQQDTIRTNSMGERHRKLPDITKIVSPNSPKRSQSTEQSVNFPNFVFTHQYNEFAEACSNRNRDSFDAGISTGALGRRNINCKRNSSIHDEPDVSSNNMNRVSRARSVDSRKNSTKSIRDARIQIESHADAKHASNL